MKIVACHFEVISKRQRHQHWNSINKFDVTGVDTNIIYNNNRNKQQPKQKILRQYKWGIE